MGAHPPDDLAGWLVETWLRRGLPDRTAARVQAVANLVAGALRHPTWIGGVLAVAIDDGAEVQDLPEGVWQDVARFWLDAWPRTCLRVAATNPLELLEAQLAATVRMARSLSEQSPAHGCSYQELLVREGAPLEILQHERDREEFARSCELDAAEAARAEADGRLAALVRVLAASGEPVLERTTRAVIRGLRELTDGRMFGVDSGLRDVWDEICVQVQWQESVYWDAYLDTIEQFAVNAVRDLPQHEQLMLWLRTDAAEDWADGDQCCAGGIPTGDEDSAKLVVDEVLHRAADWTNWRIRRAIERSYPEHD